MPPTRRTPVLLMLGAFAALAAPQATSPADASADLDVIRDRLIRFYLAFGDCTQTQFCLQGGYMLPLPGGDCSLTCAPAALFAGDLNSTGGWGDVE